MIHHGERTAVIADVHLGYEWAPERRATASRPTRWERRWRGSRGSWIGAPISRLVVAGDLVESSRPCRRTAADVDRLQAWLEHRGVSLVVLEGNHDRSLTRPPAISSRGGHEVSANGLPRGTGGTDTEPQIDTTTRRRRLSINIARPLPSTAEIDGWTIGHGHRPIREQGPSRAITTRCCGSPGSPPLAS